MDDTFEALGLQTQLARIAGELGYDAPTPIQREAIPMIRRGGNVAILASAGAGVVSAYGLGLLDRLARGERPSERPFALILQPTADAASAVALSLARLAAAVDGRVAVPLAGWRWTGEADLVVSTPAGAASGLSASMLKLDELEAVVLDGVDRMMELGAEESLEALLSAVPRDAQRVVTGEAGRVLDDVIERHVRRAVRVPPQPADERAVQRPTPATQPLGFLVVTDGDRSAAVARLLESCPGGAVLHTRGRRAAERLADELSLRSYSARADGPRIVVEGTASDTPCIISAQPPFDEVTMRERHAEAGGHVLVCARELPHLRQIAARAGVRLVPSAVATTPADELTAFRDRVRRALREEDVDAQLLVLAPLFEEASAAEVAAALAALTRRRTTAAETREAAETAGPAPSPQRAAAPPALTRLFISIGQKDRIGPGDLVGSITGEAQVRGEQIGRIDIRETFSIVEVESAIAEKVIQTLNGTTIRGRSVRADYDRRSTSAGAQQARGARRPRPGARPRRQSE